MCSVVRVYCNVEECFVRRRSSVVVGMLWLASWDSGEERDRKGENGSVGENVEERNRKAVENRWLSRRARTSAT